MNNEKSPVFIVSSGRSGTTLIRSILNASDQIYILHESDFLARAYPLYSDRHSFEMEDYEKIVKLFAKTSESSGWNMSPTYLLSCLKEKNPQDFAGVNYSLYEAYIKEKGLENVALGIKTPVLIAHLDRIFKVFPEAKVIHLVRDGRDVYLSYQNIHKNSPVKFGPKGLLTMALFWIDGLRRLEGIATKSGFKNTESSPHPRPLSHWERGAGGGVRTNKVADGQDKIYECRYEDLLNDPENTLKDLCNFLDIEYRSSMHEDYQNAAINQESLLQGFQKIIHAKLQTGIDASNQQKYLKEMSKRDRLIFELLTAPYLAKYQYPLEFLLTNTPFLSPLRSLLYFSARQYNNWRYRRRDRRAIDKIK
jgi:hypothetical protein